MSKRVVVPIISTSLITNPGIGFIAAPQLMDETGDVTDNRGEKVSRYKFTSDSRTYNHPDSKVYYCGVKWKDMEPVKGEYNWEVLEEKLEYSRSMGCTAVVRCMPYALGEDEDIPSWFREEYPDEPDFPFWRVDPENTPYIEYWSSFISAFGNHFDGHPIISSVDMALVGAWGEGGGTEFVSEDKIETIVDAYVNHFKLTPLQSLLHDPKSSKIIKDKKVNVGFRVDCLGDLGGFHGDKWSHMLDFYPQNIENFGMGKAWMKAPVVFEACWHMNDWYIQGWDIDYIIDESLKWHISSYNSKATTVPFEWKNSVERWLKKMGYRFELRKCEFNEVISRNQEFSISTLWVNTGAAPIYHKYPLTIRLRNAENTYSFISKSDIRDWLPELDILVEENFDLPHQIISGEYEVEIGIETGIPEIGTLNLAIEGKMDGYYPMGKIQIV